MKKRTLNRRDFLRLSAAAATGAIVAACAPATPQVEVEKVVPATPLPAKYPPGKLTLWSWGTPQYQEDYMKEFLLTHYPNAGIKAEALGTKGPADIQKKIMLAWAAGCVDCPDFVQSDPVRYRPMAKAGALVDLTEWVRTIEHKMPEGIFSDYTLDGKVWCFVWRANPWLMYYNREIFEKAGVKPEDIETWDDWIMAGVEIKKATKGESFLEHRDGGAYWCTAQQLVPQAGGRYFDENYNVVIHTDPKTVEVFMMLEKMYKAGVLYMTSSWNPGWYQAFREGKIAAIHFGNWWDEFLKKNLPDMAGKWGIMRMPAFSNGLHFAAWEGSAPFGIINKPDAPYVELIIELLEWQFLNRERVMEYAHQMANRGLTVFLPVLKEVYTDPFFSAPDPYYAGQSFHAEVIKSLENAPPMLPVKPDRSPIVAGIIDAELANVYAGKQDMETALKKMAEQLREKIDEIREAP